MKNLFLKLIFLLIFVNISTFLVSAQSVPSPTTAAINWEPTTVRSGTGCTTTTPSNAEPNGYQWHPGPCDYSDWIDVTDPSKFTTPAYGDGIHDDTVAIQSALNMITSQGALPGAYKAVYFPPGTYLISQTLVLGATLGANIIGSGSNTVIKWTGITNGVMFWSNGNVSMRFLGITWDGNNTASVGIDHAHLTGFFETGIRHEQEWFRNILNTAVQMGIGPLISTSFEGAFPSSPSTGDALFIWLQSTMHYIDSNGFVIANLSSSSVLTALQTQICGAPACASSSYTSVLATLKAPPQIQATAEVLFLNDVFQNNGTGASMRSFNDYDDRFLKTEFVNNTTGIVGGGGMYEVSECNFYNNTVDIAANTASLHFYSLTSQGSGMFISGAGPDTYTIDNVQVSNWTNPKGAIYLAAEIGTTTISDSQFSNSNPAAGSPIQISSQLLTTYNDTWTGPANIPMVSTSTYDISDKIINIPGTTTMPALSSAFNDTTYTTPTQIFNAVNYGGAKGNGTTDDTTAVQNTITAALSASGGAAAYFPISASNTGYLIKKQINISSGSNVTILGSGWTSLFNWGGGTAYPTMFNIIDPNNVKIEWVQLARNTTGLCYIKQTSSSQTIPSSITYDGLVEMRSASNSVPTTAVPVPFPSPVPDNSYNPCGLYLSNLSPGSTVHGIFINGPIYAANSSQAKILVEFSEGGVIDVSGAPITPATGYFNIPFRDAAGGNYFDQVVEDNGNLTIGYNYVETSFSSLLVRGTPSESLNPGHFTMNITRAPASLSPFSYRIMDDGYTGNVTFFGGPYSNNTLTTTLNGVGSPLNSSSQTPGSTNALKLLYFGENFSQPATFNLNANSSFNLLQNTFHDPNNDNYIYMDDTALSPAIAQAKSVLNDLRAMLSNNLNQTGYSTGS